MAELSEKELNLLAYTLLGEAAGEGKRGMEAVMWTIRNRAESGRFPENPASVATQRNSKGVYQYSTWNTKGDGGNSPQTRFSSDDPKFKEALAVVQRVMAGEVKDPTGGATHFYAEGSTKPAWFEAEGPAGEVKIGNHRFAARNTAPDAARDAADAAELLGNGRLRPRPQNPVSAYAPEPQSTPEQTPAESGGLTSRSVETANYQIDSKTGMPYPRLNPGTPVAPASRNPISASREVQRLQQLRTEANQRDLVGTVARTSATNQAAVDKTERVRGVDVSGGGARQSTTNKAAAAKTDRGAPPPAPVKPAVQAQNKTIQQIGQEADNARLNGYRDIQEAGPSSKGAIPKPVPVKPKPGAIKTAGTVLSDGTKLAVAGEVQMPRDVVPKVGKAATIFVKPLADPRRLVEGDPLPKLATSTARQNIRQQALEQSFNRREGAASAKKPFTIQPAAPTAEQVVAVRNRINLPKGGMQGGLREISPIVLANGAIVAGAQPQTATVAQQIARAAQPAYVTTQFQEDRFQTVTGQVMPGATNNDRWQTGYATAPSSGDSNPKNDWHWW